MIELALPMAAMVVTFLATCAWAASEAPVSERRTYDPRRAQLIFGGVPIQGFADGHPVELEVAMERSRRYRKVYKRLETDFELLVRLNKIRSLTFDERKLRDDALEAFAMSSFGAQRRIVEVVEP